MLNAINRLLMICERVFIALANSILFVLLLGNLANILARAILDVSIKWTFPWSMVLFMYLVFLGFFIFVRRGKDVTIDFVFNRFPDKARLVLAVFLNVVTLIVLGVILSQIPTIVHTQVGTIEMVGMQRYMLSMPLFLSCFLIVIQVLASTIEMLSNMSAPRRGIQDE